MQHSLFRIFTLLSLVFFSILLSLSKGSTYIPFDQLLFNPIFLELRLPRTLTSFVCGGLLALAGSLIQLLLQNPLADPYALGISGGAAVMTLFFMLLGMNEGWLLGGAWLGSLLSMLFIFLLARKHRWKTDALLLSGIALACGFSGCISFILVISPQKDLPNLLFWLAGDLNDARLPWTGLIILSAGLLIGLLLSRGFNILGQGDQKARSLGLSTEKYRMVLYLLSSLLTATAVTLAGCIGFVGLIIPHITRFFTGYDYRFILPISVLLGGSFLTLADTLARTLFAPQQLPVGILMAIIGIPIFIWLLQPS